MVHVSDQPSGKEIEVVVAKRVLTAALQLQRLGHALSAFRPDEGRRIRSTASNSMLARLVPASLVGSNRHYE